MEGTWGPFYKDTSNRQQEMDSIFLVDIGFLSNNAVMTDRVLTNIVKTL
jgi:hypothetical protein